MVMLTMMMIVMRRMMMTITIYALSPHHIYKGLLTVEMKGKKNVFNGRILEIEEKKVGRLVGR